MSVKQFASTALGAVRTGLVSTAIFQLAIGSAFASGQTAAPPSRDNDTSTPIKHVIVIIGENRTFDHIFATYVPVKGETVNNLLSEGIVKADGTPGPNFPVAEQKAATDTPPDAFLLSPTTSTFSGSVLPAPLNGGPTDSYVKNDDLTLARQSENGLPADYYAYLVTGGSGLSGKVPDTRIKNVTALPPGPFQLTNGDTFTYNSYAASPVHRFYQMWQQLDCSVSHITAANPSGCDAALFPWVETTVGAGTNGLKQPATFSTEYSPSATTTGEGSTAMGFYNVQNGDAPYFKYLADNYAMSDNFHQSVNGGTGANHIMFGHGDAIWFSDGKGNPAVPPHNVTTGAGVNAGIVDEVENPNPAPSTNNWYTEDGYGGGSFGAASYGGGSYTNCADTTQPGVAPITNYLKSLPPSSVPSIGDKLISNHISWKYYGDQWNNYVPDPYQLNYGAVGKLTDEYCNICNPFQYDTSIMANAAVRTAHIQDTANLYSDIKAGTLPAVSIVKPSGLVDGHPSSSKLDLFEGFTKKIVDEVKKNPTLWKDTAIFITEDEGGGYYDSGYVQPLDYFGDGTRIPLIVVSPYTKAGHIAHDYADHVSILKFIEANWGMETVSTRSRDNYPNPIATPDNPYVPVNSPAIDDLMSLFNF